MNRVEFKILIIFLVIFSIMSYGINKLLTDDAEDSQTVAKYENLALISEDGTYQIVKTSVIPGAYEQITVYKDIPVEWEIEALEENLNNCNQEFLCEKFGLDVKLNVGNNMVNFTPNEVGTFEYSCWMDMIHSNIVVIER